MAYREFTDSAGIVWRAWDTRPRSGASVRPQYANGWISFESEAGRRRLVPVPETWEDATEDELWEFLAHAQPLNSPPIVSVPPIPPTKAAPGAETPNPEEDSPDSVLTRVRSVLRNLF